MWDSIFDLQLSVETNGVVTMLRDDEPGLYHPAEAGGLRIGKRRRAH